jgi:PLP dependent protein
MINKEFYRGLTQELSLENVQLIAVSKTKSVSDIQELYDLGHRDFGENYVQELTEKQRLLPKDIRWHFIGHLQTNKVKDIAPFVHLIQSVDSMKLLIEINKQALRIKREIPCLLEVHIAEEESKFGLNEQEVDLLIAAVTEMGIENAGARLLNIRICGLMGMSSLTSDELKIIGEFRKLKAIFEKYKKQETFSFRIDTLSMGMSSDYKMAIMEGSNMVRIGSLLFGERAYNK